MGRRKKGKPLSQEASREALYDAARVMTAGASEASTPIELVVEFYSYCLHRQISDFIKGRLSFGEMHERAVRASLRLCELWTKHRDRIESVPGVYANLAATAFRQAFETPETLAKRGRQMLSARGGHAKWDKMPPQQRTAHMRRMTEEKKRRAAERRGAGEAATGTAQVVRLIGPAPKCSLHK